MNIISGNNAVNIPFNAVRGHAYVNVTPDIAQSWLQHNSANRIFVRGNFDFIKSQMIEGTWRDNGECIKFSYGKLIDGQHRLTAIAETGLPQIVSVEYGLDPEVQSTIDTGRKRSSAAVLSIEGMTPWECNVVGTGIHTLINYDKGLAIYNREKSTNEKVRTYFIEHAGEIASSTQVVKSLPRQPSIIPSAMSFALHVIFSRLSPEMATEFIQQIHNPVGLPANSPIMVLHNRLIADMLYKKKRSTYEKFGFVIKAWNIYRRNGSIKTDHSLRILNGSDFPEIK